MMMNKVCICWRNLSTGAMGRGEPIPRWLAEAWIEHLSHLKPGIEYWLEVVPKSLRRHE